MNQPRSRFSNLETKPDRTSAAGPTGAPSRDAGYYMAQGRQAELAGEQGKALTHYSAALGENPLLVEAWTAQLWMLLYLDEPLEAHLWADRALETFPNQPDLLALKSLSLGRCCAWPEAWEINDAALAGSRESANVWLARGALQTGSGFAAATTAACFRHALAASADRPLTNLRIGDVYTFYQQFAEAEPYLSAAATQLQDSAWAWYGYGQAQRALGWESPALAALARAVRLAPGDERYHAALIRREGWLKRFQRRLAQLFQGP